MTCRRWSSMVASILLAGTIGPSPAQAQTCFRGRPLPTCGSFWITEAGYGRRPQEGGEHHFSWELGGMRNLNEESAVGATVYLTLGYSEAWGLKARYRRWLSSSTSLEVAPGMLIEGGGFTGHVAVNFADRVAPTLAFDVLDERSFLSLGAKAGSEVGLVVAAIEMVVVGVWYAVCVSSDCLD